ncbi:rhodanese-like domain-containing protein [Bacillaceae bacterium S4-13-58]
MNIKKRSLYVSILALVIVFAYNYMNPSEIQSISTEDLANRLQGKNGNDALYIDVREHDEFEAGHIEGMLNFPLSNLEESMKKIPKDIEVVIICQSGNRSMQAAELFQKNGYENIVNVEGGINSWQGELVQK